MVQTANILSINGVNNSWKTLLDSEGIQWSPFEQSLDPAEVKVAIFPKTSSRKALRASKEIVAAGGSVVIEENPYLEKAFDFTEEIFFPYRKDCFTGVINGESSDRFRVRVSRRSEGGTVFCLPFELNDLWHQTEVGKRYIVIDSRKNLLVWENLNIVNRKNLRKAIVDVLFRAFSAVNTLFIKKNYWPNGNRCVFCLRADMDDGRHAILEKYLLSVSKFRKSLTLAVCGKAYNEKRDILDRIYKDRIETVNHTFTHYVYKSYQHNKNNILLNQDILAFAKLHTKGYVGPASFWFPSMYRVLEENGYRYTSSFGLDHDTIPYFPSLPDGKVYDLVELPFHCLGDRFPHFDLGLDSSIVHQFFDDLIEKKYSAGEPINLYGHPDMPGRMGDYPELVKRICTKALSHSDVWTGSMGELARWWRRRHSASCTPVFDAAQGVVKAFDLVGSEDVYWNIHTPDGRWFLVDGASLREGVHLDRKTPMTPLSVPGPMDVGEVVAPPPEKTGIKGRLREKKRAWERERRKIRELRQAMAAYRGERK